MSHVNMKELLADAQRREYGVLNLWGNSMEMILGQIAAAEELKAPLSLCFCRGQYPTMPIDLGVKLVVDAAEHAKVPVMTILDHGRDFGDCIQAMHYGLSAIMFDGSYMPYEENVEITRELVRIARPIGVSVEAELGAVGGSVEWGVAEQYESLYTDPDQVVDFVKATEVDSLAISFGNRHGLYKGKPNINFDLAAKIRKLTDVPLVMHGASDLADEMYPKIVKSGISKIHFWSGPSKECVKNLRQKLDESEQSTVDIGYQDIFRWNVDFFTEITKKYLRLVNADGKACIHSRGSIASSARATTSHEQKGCCS
jgi:fructose-bisphosphate aldolase, class II